MRATSTFAIVDLHRIGVGDQSVDRVVMGCVGEAGMHAGRTGMALLASGAIAAMPLAQHSVPLFPPDADDTYEGFVRIVNHTDEEGHVSVVGIDDMGVRHDPITIPVSARQTLHFNSTDLEVGNPAKGLSHGIGAGSGDWRLLVNSTDLCCIDVLSYIRTADGFLTGMHDVARWSCGYVLVPTFNPGSNTNQVSRLRLINPNDEQATITVMGVDDDGHEPAPTKLTLEPGHARTITAQQLEDGDNDLEGAFGDGKGKWQLYFEANVPVLVMSLLESPTGHLTNLSTTRSDRHHVPPSHGVGCRAIAHGWGGCRPADYSNYCPDAEHLAVASCANGEAAWHSYIEGSLRNDAVETLVRDGIDEGQVVELRQNRAHFGDDGPYGTNHWQASAGRIHNRTAQVYRETWRNILYRAPRVDGDTTATITLTAESEGYCSTTTVEFTVNETD